MARAIVLAEGELGRPLGKTANGLVLHSVSDDIVAVIDSTHAGQDAGAVVAGRPLGIPVVATLDEALEKEPQRIYMGVANVGGVLDPGFRATLLAAARAGLEVVNGLHVFLSEDPEFQAAGGRVVDIRRVPDPLRVADGTIQERATPRLLVMGMDCDIGKRITAIELVNAARSRGLDTGFVATGQTGCMLGPDAGTVIDRVPADFAAGQVEGMFMTVSDAGKDLVIGYGQASIQHPAYSGVATAVLHGAAPHAVILQVAPGRTQRALFDHPTYTLGDVLDEIELLEALGRTRVVGLAMNASDADDPEGARFELATRTGLPVVDPLHEDVGPLLDAALAAVTPAQLA